RGGAAARRHSALCRDQGLRPGHLRQLILPVTDDVVAGYAFRRARPDCVRRPRLMRREGGAVAKALADGKAAGVGVRPPDLEPEASRLRPRQPDVFGQERRDPDGFLERAAEQATGEVNSLLGAWRFTICLMLAGDGRINCKESFTFRTTRPVRRRNPLRGSAS